MEICIHSEGCPPTDHIMNVMMMIQHDESDLWNLGNLHSIKQPRIITTPVPNNKNLVEYYNSLKNEGPMQKVCIPMEPLFDNVAIA